MENPDTLSMYLTYDIAINSSLFVWESIEKSILKSGRNGDLKMYSEAFNHPIPKEEREKRFSYIAIDLSDGSEQLVAMESVKINRENGGFLIHQKSPFNGQDLICGYIEEDDLIKVLTPNEAAYIKSMIHFNCFPKTGTELSGSKMYSASALLLDTTQRYLAMLVEQKKSLSTFDEKYLPLDFRALVERAEQMNDSMDQNDKVYSVTARVPEYDMWKGYLATGVLGNEQHAWSYFGLLYHPNSKFAGFNPGKIVWFNVEADELDHSEPLLSSYLKMLAKNALLYSADPVNYRSQYFTNNSIRIDNGRYPNAHGH